MRAGRRAPRSSCSVPYGASRGRTARPCGCAPPSTPVTSSCVRATTTGPRPTAAPVCAPRPTPTRSCAPSPPPTVWTACRQGSCAPIWDCTASGTSPGPSACTSSATRTWATTSPRCAAWRSGTTCPGSEPASSAGSLTSPRSASGSRPTVSSRSPASVGAARPGWRSPRLPACSSSSPTASSSPTSRPCPIPRSSPVRWRRRSGSPACPSEPGRDGPAASWSSSWRHGRCSWCSTTVST